MTRDQRLKYYQELIYQILDEAARKQGLEDSRQILIYKMGYLIGWLSMAADDDTIVAEQIRKKMQAVDPNWGKHH